MEINSLIEVLEIPTISEGEKRIVDYLCYWGAQNHVPVRIDVYGNVYLIKGFLNEGESYPCVVAHLDTVHRSQYQLIDVPDSKLIIEVNEGRLTAKNPITNKQTGIGGDDKAGVAICLELIKNTDKIIGAFFLSEEIGCLGSKHSDDEWLKDVGYFIEFDAPGNNWLSYVSQYTQLFNKSFFKLIDNILLRYGISNIREWDPFTDVYVLKRKYPVNCLNFFAGYYKMHSPEEYVIFDDVVKAVNMGSEIIQCLGNSKYPFEYSGRIQHISEVIF